MSEIPIHAMVPAQVQSPRDHQLYAAAQELEATFLAEMLKSAGLGELPEGFGGGPGEEQFSSMLTMEHARALSRSGGIGLAESLFNAMKEKIDD